MDRIRCTIIVLTILSIGFVIGGILLITCSNSIIKKAVRKVRKVCASFFFV
jgi:hypothetical protein